MELRVSSVVRPLAGSEAALAVSEAAPVVLSLELIDDEWLRLASLVVRRSTEADPGIPAVVLDTSANGSTTDVVWVVASWGQARQVEALTLAFTSKPDPLVVRVHIGRGDSAWFLPPGPHMFTMQAAMQLHVALPDVVADRVMVEFLNGAGSSVPVSLPAIAPLVVARGSEPRDLTLAVRGRRPLLRWGGAIPADNGLVVGDLSSRLVADLRGEIGPPGVTLELRAAVAGVVELEWELGSVQVAQRFAGGEAMRTLSIPWVTSVDEPLLPSAVASTQIEALALSVAVKPAAEQLVLAPEQTPATHGQLVRPLYDVAQAIELPTSCLLTGIDALVRTPGGAKAMTLSVHDDDGGRPGPSAMLELERELAGPTSEATWISFDCPKPFPIAAGSWWLVLRVEDGELVWLITEPTSAPGLRYRRDPGPWLPRLEPNGAEPRAVLRVRAASDPPAQPLAIALRGVAIDGAEPTAWEIPLPIDLDGKVRWSAGPTDPPPLSTSVSLRLTAAVASTVVLSNLALRHRPSP